MEINALSGKSLNAIAISNETVATESPVQAPASVEQVKERNPEKEEVAKAVKSINRFLQTSQTHLKFVLHEELNEYYVIVVNDHTQEVVREIPSKKVLDIAAKMQEMIGLLVDERR